MKKLLLLSLFLVTACSAKQSNVTKISDTFLINFLVFSEMKDLNKTNDEIDKKLWIKLYKVPNKADNNCFPESHGVCSYHYYLATSQLDDSPIINAYSLGTYGEIVSTQWQSANTDEEKAIINFQVNKYSQLALQYNKKLKNEKTTYQLVAMPNEIIFDKVKPNN